MSPIQREDDHSAQPLKILWLSGMSPVGVTSGLAMYTTGLAEAVAADGNTVRGIGIGSSVAGPDGSGAPTLMTWTTINSEPCGRVRSLFSLTPYIAARLNVADHRRAVVDALDDDPDVVILDHLMSGWCLARVLKWRKRTGGLIAHVSHNYETAVRDDWASSTSLLTTEGLYLRYDVARIRRLERKVFAAADLISTITLADRRAISGSVEFDRSMVLTPGWTPRARPESSPIGERPRQVLVLGSFDWQAKRENLEAVVAAFDPPFAKAGITLLVVGSGDDVFLERQMGRWRATKFLGHIADLDSVLDSCRVGVVAEPVGGGFKLKALDYGFAGLPMAVLDGSIAGMDLESGRDVLAASTLEDLASQIVEVIDDEERLVSMALSVRHRLDGRHDWSDRGEQLSSRLQSHALRGRQADTSGAAGMVGAP